MGVLRLGEIPEVITEVHVNTERPLKPFQQPPVPHLLAEELESLGSDSTGWVGLCRITHAP